MAKAEVTPSSHGVFLLFLVIGAAALNAYQLAGLTDDAFISFRFARNLANGHGFVWNLSEQPVEGFTNFLWTLLCAALLRLHVNLLLAAQWLGVISGLVTIALTFFFGRRLFALSPQSALFVCAILAISGPIPSWASSGLETTFFGMWLLAGCGMLGLARNRQSMGRLAVGCLCLLLAGMTRLEGAMVFVVSASVTLAAWAGGRRWWALTVMLVGFVLPFAVYFLGRWNYFGAPLPNTFYAKTGGTVFQYLRGVVYTGYFVIHFLLPLLWIPLLLIWDHHGRSASASPPGNGDPSRLGAGFGAVLFAAVVCVYTLYIVYVGGDYLPYYRFFVPIMPLIYLLFGLGARQLADSARSSRVRRNALRLLTVGSLVALGMNSTTLGEYVFAQPPVTQGNYRATRKGYWHTARLELIGDFFQKYKRGDEESLFTGAIGIVSWRTTIQVFDQHGIVDPIVARQPSRLKHPGWGLAGHEKDGLMRALERRATFLMLDRRLTPDPLPVPTFPPAVEAIIRTDYHMKSVWLIDAKNSQEGYFNFLERNDRDTPATDPL